MAKTTVMDIYVKGEIVFSYVREKNSFDYCDVKVHVHDVEQGN